MESRYEPTGKDGDAAVINYHQVAPSEDDDGFTPRYIPGGKWEPSKQVLKRRLSFSQFFVHIFALMTTVAVIGVNFANVYGWDQGSLRISDSQVNNILQFAAKLHEILIIASLSLIVMHRIRKRLVGSRGLPIGLLSSGYQASSIPYLLSGSFWSAIATDSGLVFALAATIIYFNVVGPSSAIVLIPRLNWWDVHGPFNSSLQLYLDSSLDQLYPTDLGPPNMTLYQGCDTLEYTSGCPGAAFDDLRDWAAAWYNNGVNSNISLTEPTTEVQRAVVFEIAQLTFANAWNLTEPNTNPNISVTTTLTQPMIQLAGLFWDYIQENQMGTINSVKRAMLASSDAAPVYAPVVQVQCAWFNYSEAIKSPSPDNPVVGFPLDVLDNYTGISTSISWPVDPSFWNFTRPMNATNFTWIDLSSYSDGDGPGASLGALITLPILAVDGARRNDTFWDVSQQSWLIPCLINAKWAAAKIQYDPNNSNQITQNITEPASLGVGDGTNVTEASRQPWGLSDTISISPKWAALLNVAGISSTSASGESFESTMVEALLNQFVTSDVNPIYSPYMAVGQKFATFAPPQTTNVIPATIAAVVVEGLSRQAYNWTQPFVLFDERAKKSALKRLTQQKGWGASALFAVNESLAEIMADVAGDSTPIDFNIKRYGYGYGYKGSYTVGFGLTVLLTHATVAIGYIVYLLYYRFAGSGFSSGAWGNLGEMLTLALYSARARELQNVGGGVKSRSTWKQRVRIRERTGDRLELVVGTENLDDAQPQLNKYYI